MSRTPRIDLQGRSLKTGRLQGLSLAERDIEDLVRTVDCPVCGQPSGRRCYYNGAAVLAAHTGRYNVAAEAGLVPRMVGTR